MPPPDQSLPATYHELAHDLFALGEACRQGTAGAALVLARLDDLWSLATPAQRKALAADKAIVEDERP